MPLPPGHSPSPHSKLHQTLAFSVTDHTSNPPTSPTLCPGYSILDKPGGFGPLEASDPRYRPSRNRLSPAPPIPTIPSSYFLFGGANSSSSSREPSLVAPDLSTPTPSSVPLSLPASAALLVHKTRGRDLAWAGGGPQLLLFSPCPHLLPPGTDTQCSCCSRTWGGHVIRVIKWQLQSSQ